MSFIPGAVMVNIVSLEDYLKVPDTADSNEFESARSANVAARRASSVKKLRAAALSTLNQRQLKLEASVGDPS